jgi:hypothetical protein
MADNSDADVNRNPPIVIDLGKQKKKRIKQLKRGRGRLVERVNEAVAQVRSALGAEAQGKEFVPVAVIVRRGQKCRKGMFPFMG